MNELLQLPKMRPRRRATMKQIIKLLRDAATDLMDSGCTFWACDGPAKFVHMKTCRRCQCVRDLATVIATLEDREKFA